MNARASEEFKRRIKESNELVGVIRSYGIELKRSGRNWKACCPFHQEKTPSFNVNPDGQYFKCFGCDKSGDVLTFVGLYERVEFPEALRLLADRASIPFESDPQSNERYQQEKDWKHYLYKLNSAAAAYFRERLLSDEGREARAYLQARGITEDSWALFNLGYAPDKGSALLERLQKQRAPVRALQKAGLVNQREDGSGYDYFRGRLMFPITDSQDRVIGFGGRVLGDGQPKYLNTRDTPLFSKSRTVYGISQARETIVEKRTAVLVEGYTDVIMCHQFGIRNVIAALGTAITADHIRSLRRQADKLALLTDSDPAGAQASERSVELLFQEDMQGEIVRLPGSSKDPCEFLLSEGAQAFEEALEHGVSLFDFKFQQTARKFDLASTTGQTQAARELMRVASLAPDPIQRAAYRRDIAGRLNLPEQELTFDKNRNESRTNDASQTESEVPFATQPVPKPEHALAHAERELLRWMFHQPAWTESVIVGGEVDLANFHGRLERVLARAVLLAFEEGKIPPSPDELFEEHSSPGSIVAKSIMNTLSEALQGLDPSSGHSVAPSIAERLCIELAEMAPEHQTITPQEAYDLRLDALKHEQLKFNLDALRRAEAAAKAAGETERLKAISEQRMGLLVQLKAWKRGFSKEMAR